MLLFDKNTHYTKPVSRNLGLDCLRSLGILIVLLNHGLIGFFFSREILPFEGWLAKFSASAVLSIEWLFLLSGYLIGAIMIRSFESDRNWVACSRDFWLRRWFRTLPNYYLFLILNMVLVYWEWRDGLFDWKFLVFSQNLAWTENFPYFFGESWSLALDEWFYIVMPLLLGVAALLGCKNNQRRFLLISLLLILGPMLLRAMHAPSTEFFGWDAEIRRITIYHLDATGWGVLAATMNKWYKSWWRSYEVKKAFLGFALMGAGLYGACDLLQPVTPIMGRIWDVAVITCMAAGTFFVMPWLTLSSSPKPLLAAFTSKLSNYTYSIYLSHFPMMFIIIQMLKVSGRTDARALTIAVIAWVITVLLLSALTYHLFEGPVANLRERFTHKVDASPF
jgi:peptidoglycan/LPS O-acetylase OafA/YrhL